MARSLGRWQRVLIDALAEQETVVVETVVAENLGRQATRAERNASQRAAHRLARDGGVRITSVHAPAGTGRARLAVTRPPDWPGDWLDQDEDDSAQPVPVRWVDPPLHPSTPPARLGRWQEVIMDALAEHEMVGLRAVVEGHLGRRAAWAESTAAQRAARLLARSGQVSLAHVRVRSAKGRRSAELLLIVRAGLDPEAFDERMMQAAAVRLVTPADRTEEAHEHIVAAVQEAAARLADIDLHTVDGEAAGKAAQALASPLLRLSQLRQSLLMRRPRP